MPFAPIPINTGTVPDWNTRFGFPSIRNMFVGSSGNLYSTAGLDSIANLSGVRGFYETKYNGGSYFAVTKNQILNITYGGAIFLIKNILDSNLPVQIDENLRNQIVISDCTNGYVYDQQTSVFTQLSAANNFEITNPVSVIVVNSFAIWLDGKTGVWIWSNPNNAIAYNPLNQNQIDNNLSIGMGLEKLESNFYIFGSTGIERWQPTLSSNIYISPFQKDTNFMVDFGAISTDSIINSVNKIYFLSSRYLPMEITASGWNYLPNLSPNSPICVGISKIISEYPDVKRCYGSFYSFRGNFFYHLSFLQSGIAWVWCESSQKWALSDDLIVGASRTSESIALQDGIYTLTLAPANIKRELVLKRLCENKKIGTFRNLLKGVSLDIVQGSSQFNLNHVQLAISKDSRQWQNTVSRPIGKTGQTQCPLQWMCVVSFRHEITLKFTFYGELDFAIEGCNANIN